LHKENHIKLDKSIKFIFGNSTFFDCENYEIEKLKIAVMQVFLFFEVYDQIENTNHFQILIGIYVNKKLSYKNQTIQSYELGIEDRTLYRYKKKYYKCIKYYYEQVGQKRSENINSKILKL